MSSPQVVSLPQTAVGIPSPGGSLPAATHVGKVRLAVSNLDASLRFYREVIGLELLGREGTTASLGVHGGQPLLELEQLSHGRPLRGRRIGLYHLAILLPERPALVSFLQHLGKLNVPNSLMEHGVSEAAYLADPDGLAIEVYADRPRSQWEVRNGFYVAESIPLDARMVTRLAAPVWDGLPQGTTIGHVHSCVSDLARAAHFYHTTLGLDLVLNAPNAHFLSAGGYHHHVGINTWAAGSPKASADDPRILSWELVLPDAASVAKVAERLNTTVRAEPGTPASYTDQDGIRVVLVTPET